MLEQFLSFQNCFKISGLNVDKKKLHFSSNSKEITGPIVKNSKDSEWLETSTKHKICTTVFIWIVNDFDIVDHD